MAYISMSRLILHVINNSSRETASGVQAVCGGCKHAGRLMEGPALRSPPSFQAGFVIFLLFLSLMNERINELHCKKNTVCFCKKKKAAVVAG